MVVEEEETKEVQRHDVSIVTSTRVKLAIIFGFKEFMLTKQPK